MAGVSHVYDVPDTAQLRCDVKGRIALPNATVELHHYRFTGPQAGTFRSERAFLDLALSRRPGAPHGTYAARPNAGWLPMGDLIFIPAGQDLATEWGEGEQLSICCGFDRIAGDEDNIAADLRAPQAMLDVRSPYVREALLRLAREIEAPGFGSAVLAEAILTEIGIDLARYFRGSAVDRDSPSRLTSAQLRRIEDAIEEPGRLPPIADLARLCDVSTRHFFRLFRASTGITLAVFAAERRMARARALLAVPRAPIKEIAWRCGFETPAAFSAAFRKATGLTPKQYRLSVLN